MLSAVIAATRWSRFDRLADAGRRRLVPRGITRIFFSGGGSRLGPCDARHGREVVLRFSTQKLTGREVFRRPGLDYLSSSRTPTRAQMLTKP